MEKNNLELAIKKEFPRKVIPLIEQAKSSIKIIVYDWRWYPENIGASIQVFNQAIVRANNRGVVVKAIVQREDIAKILKKLGIWVKKVDFSRTLHIKLLIIDEKIVVLGSHNYTLNAFHLNDEISVIIKNEEIVKKLNRFFGNYFL